MKNLILAIMLLTSSLSFGWTQGTSKTITADNVSGLENSIKQGDAEVLITGINAYNDGAVARPIDCAGGTATVTMPRSSTSPIYDKYSWVFTKPAGNVQGQGIAIDFKINGGDQTKMLKLALESVLDSGTFSASGGSDDSDLIAVVYDKTNSKLVNMNVLKFLSIGNDTPFTYFQASPDSTDYRLCLHVAKTSTSAWSMKLDNISATRSTVVVGSIITDWQSYTPTFSTASGTLPTRTLDYAQWMQVGSNAYYRGKITFTGTGTWNGPQFTLPSGQLIKDYSDIVILPSTINMNPTGIGNNRGAAFAWALSNQTIRLVADGGSGAGPVAITQAAPFTWASGNSLVWDIGPVPIQGWSAGAQLADGYDGRVVAGLAYRGTSQTLAPNSSTVKVNIDTISNTTFPDKSAIFEAANSRFVIKSAGSYVVYAGINIGGTNVLASQYQTVVRLTRNGTPTDIGIHATTPAAGSVLNLQGFRLIDLEAGDIVELYLQGAGNNSTNTITALAGSQTGLSLFKLSGSAFMSPTATVAVIANNSSGQSIPNNATTAITGWTKTTDTHNAFNAATGIFTAPEAGIYEFSGNAEFVSAAYAAQDRLYMAVVATSATKVGPQTVIPASLTTSLAIGFSGALVEMKAGETASIVIRNTRAGGATLLSTITSSIWFNVTKVK